MNNDIDVKRRFAAAELLESVLAGADASLALEEWPFCSPTSDPVLADAMSSLAHYASDEDIRLKDASYAEWQRAGLAELVSKLRVLLSSSSDSYRAGSPVSGGMSPG